MESLTLITPAGKIEARAYKDKDGNTIRELHPVPKEYHSSLKGTELTRQQLAEFITVVRGALDAVGIDPNLTYTPVINNLRLLPVSKSTMPTAEELSQSYWDADIKRTGYERH